MNLRPLDKKWKDAHFGKITSMKSNDDNGKHLSTLIIPHITAEFKTKLLPCQRDDGYKIKVNFLSLSNHHSN